jgi:hypothetical protein
VDGGEALVEVVVARRASPASRLVLRRRVGGLVHRIRPALGRPSRQLKVAVGLIRLRLRRDLDLWTCQRGWVRRRSPAAAMAIGGEARGGGRWEFDFWGAGAAGRAWDELGVCWASRPPPSQASAPLHSRSGRWSGGSRVRAVCRLITWHASQPGSGACAQSDSPRLTQSQGASSGRSAQAFSFLTERGLLTVSGP